MIKLRKFLPEDLEQIMEIEKASFPAKEAWSKSYFEKIYQEYPKGFIIAENKEKIIGYIAGKIKNETGEIFSLAVSPDWRRQKIGTQLFNYLINQFKKRKIKEISIYVRTKNKAGISFYENFGFKILKTIENYYSNGDNAYLMKGTVSSVG